jgi:hypothetical protein
MIAMRLPESRDCPIRLSCNRDSFHEDQIQEKPLVKFPGSFGDLETARIIGTKIPYKHPITWYSSSDGISDPGIRYSIKQSYTAFQVG